MNKARYILLSLASLLVCVFAGSKSVFAECKEDEEVLKSEAGKGTEEHEIKQHLAEVSKKPIDGMVRLSVPKMRCSSCGKKIEAALRAFPGVRSIRVHERSRMIDVETDSRVKGADVVALIKDKTGYEASVVGL